MAHFVATFRAVSGHVGVVSVIHHSASVLHTYGRQNLLHPCLGFLFIAVSPYSIKADGWISDIHIYDQLGSDDNRFCYLTRGDAHAISCR